MLFAQCLKLGYAGIPALAHDEHALLAARAIRKDQIVGGGENPFIVRVQQKRKVLHVVVAIMRKDVEAGQRIGPLCVQQYVTERVEDMARSKEFRVSSFEFRVSNFEFYQSFLAGNGGNLDFVNVSPLSNREKKEFYSGLARLIRSGSALPNAIELLARDTPPRLGDFLRSLNARIKAGEPLGGCAASAAAKGDGTRGEYCDGGEPGGSWTVDVTSLRDISRRWCGRARK